VVTLLSLHEPHTKSSDAHAVGEKESAREYFSDNITYRDTITSFTEFDSQQLS